MKTNYELINLQINGEHTAVVRLQQSITATESEVRIKIMFYHENRIGCWISSIKKNEITTTTKMLVDYCIIPDADKLLRDYHELQRIKAIK